MKKVPDYLEHILAIDKYREVCSERLVNLSFSKNDIRKTIFAKIRNILNLYISQPIFFILMRRLRNFLESGILIKICPNEKERYAISLLGMYVEEGYSKTLLDASKNALVFQLWSILEDYFDQLYSSLSDETDIKQLTDSNFYKIKDLLEGKLDEDELELVRNKLENHHIPINNKYNRIIGFLDLNKSEKREFRNYLEFFGILRNTLHNNSIPKKDYEFKLKSGKYVFKKECPIDVFSLEIIEENLELFLRLCLKIGKCQMFQNEIFDRADTKTQSSQ